MKYSYTYSNTDNTITVPIFVQMLLFKWLTYHTMKVWESEFDNIVSKREKLQDIKINQLKVEVHDSYKKMRK